MAENEVMNNENQFLDWDAEISLEEQKNYYIEPGSYKFEVATFDKETYTGSSEKVPRNTPIAKITLKIVNDGEEYYIIDRFYMLKSVEWKISQFMKAIGIVDEEDKTGKINFSDSITREGWVEIKDRVYENKNGEEKTSSQVVKYYKPSEVDKLLEAKKEKTKATKKKTKKDESFVEASDKDLNGEDVPF